MNEKNWIVVIAMMFLITSSMYVGAFITKHSHTRNDPAYVHEYRGHEHTVRKVTRDKGRITIWPFVDIEYDIDR